MGSNSAVSSLGPHSYDPGLLPSGAFWITRIPEDSIDFEFDEAEASMSIRNVCLFDAFTVPNSLTANHPFFGIARAEINSLVMRWQGVKRKVHVENPSAGFSGDFIEDTATIAVTATTQASSPPFTSLALHGFRFVSDPAATSKSNFAQIGRMQDGVFFT